MGGQASKKRRLNDITRLQLVKYPTIDHFALFHWKEINEPKDIPLTDFIVSKIHVRFCGQLGVGKNAIISRLLNISTDQNRDYSSSDELFNCIDKSYNINDIDLKIRFVIQNSETIQQMDLMRTGFYFVVYDITDAGSFEEAKRLVSMIKANKHNKYHEGQIITLIGNKIDLEPLRQVSKAQGEEFSNLNNCIFYEISAFWNSGKDIKKIISKAITMYINEELKDVDELKRAKFSYLEHQREKLYQSNKVLPKHI